MTDVKQLERATENYIREVETAAREIAALLKTVREVEQLAAAVDTVDLRNSFSLKSDVSRLKNEVGELTRNLQALTREMSDTNSKIGKALY